MDEILDGLTTLVTGLRYEEVPADIVHCSKRAVLDSLGCAYAGWNSDTCRMVRHIVETASIGNPENSAHVLGTSKRVSPDLAAFANATMIRYLDYNDHYLDYDEGGLLGAGHPSDAIGAALAGAELASRDGRSLIVGVIAAYEVFARLCTLTYTDTLDYATAGVVAAAAGASAAMGFSHDKVAHALSLALVPNVALRATRVGELSMWKAAASGNLARNGLFAAILANAGMTGPARPFVGPGGLCEIANPRVPCDSVLARKDQFAISTVNIKRYPAGIYCQTAIEAALDIASRGWPIENIEEIRVGTSSPARTAMGSTPERWKPATRETADHSIPYVVAAAIAFKGIRPESFESSYLSSASVGALLGKLIVEVDEECERRFPQELMTRVTVQYTGGHIERAVVRNFHGHASRPLTDAEMNARFHEQGCGVLTRVSEKRLRDMVWNLERVSSMTDLMEAAIATRGPRSTVTG